MMPRVFPFLVPAILAGLAAATSARAQDADCHLRSGFLGQPVAGGHIITIKGQLGGEAQLTLDGNSFSLNAFGDIESQTEMAAVPVKVTIKRLDSADPSGKGRRIFRLEGAPQGTWNLILPARGEKGARLVVTQRGRAAPRRETTRVIPLQSQGAKRGLGRAAPKAPAPNDKVRGKPRTELGRGAKYSAVYKGGELIVTARGTAPTVQYTVALERGKKPGRFELWWQAPSGPVIMVLPPPYEVELRTRMAARPKTITIRDRDGKHTIPVS